jgi:transposase
MDLMSAEQWKRSNAVRRIQEGALTVVMAAQMLGLSSRQVRRLMRRVEKGGEKSLSHGNAGRSPAHRVEAGIRERVVALMRGRYAGFNDQHFTEKLAAHEGLKLSRSTVRRILREAGIAPTHRRRARKHRRRRDRKEQAGLMVLWDGSRHEWLEGRGAMMCLMGAIDDATGELLPGAHFLAHESAAAYLRVLLAIAREKGLPWSVYMDQHGALKRNDANWTLEEELKGRQNPTQVGLALRTLSIESIHALSPQAKGRVERLWGTLQDRLTSDLRLAGASTVDEANAVLAEHRVEHNRRFAVKARDTRSAWRAVPSGLDVERICSFRYEAVVGNDNTVRIGSNIFDIPPGPDRRSYARARVEVRQILDGSWRIYSGEDLIASAASTTEGAAIRALKRRRGAGEKQKRKPDLRTRKPNRWRKALGEA